VRGIREATHRHLDGLAATHVREVTDIVIDEFD
jgi:hypothetical protein